MRSLPFILALALLPVAYAAPTADLHVGADDRHGSCSGQRSTWQDSYDTGGARTEYIYKSHNLTCETYADLAHVSLHQDGERVAEAGVGGRGEEAREGSNGNYSSHASTCDGAPCDRGYWSTHRYEDVVWSSSDGAYVGVLDEDASVSARRCEGSSSSFMYEWETTDNGTGARDGNLWDSWHVTGSCATGLFVDAAGEDVVAQDAFVCSSHESAFAHDHADGERHWGNSSSSECRLAREQAVEAEGQGAFVGARYDESRWQSCGARESAPEGSCWDYRGTFVGIEAGLIEDGNRTRLVNEGEWFDYIGVFNGEAPSTLCGLLVEKEELRETFLLLGVGCL